MNYTTPTTEYAQTGIQMLTACDEENHTTYYWEPKMGLIIAENEIGDIGVVYKTKKTIPDKVDSLYWLLNYIEMHSEDGVLDINIFYSIEEIRAFIKAFFQNLTGQQG